MRIAALYKIEDSIRGCDPGHRPSVRQNLSRPLVDEFFTWLAAQAKRVSRKSELMGLCATDQRVTMSSSGTPGELTKPSASDRHHRCNRKINGAETPHTEFLPVFGLDAGNRG